MLVDVSAIGGSLDPVWASASALTDPLGTGAESGPGTATARSIAFHPLLPSVLASAVATTASPSVCALPNVVLSVCAVPSPTAALRLPTSSVDSPLADPLNPVHATAGDATMAE